MKKTSSCCRALGLLEMMRKHVLQAESIGQKWHEICIAYDIFFKEAYAIIEMIARLHRQLSISHWKAVSPIHELTDLSSWTQTWPIYTVSVHRYKSHPTYLVFNAWDGIHLLHKPHSTLSHSISTTLSFNVIGLSPHSSICPCHSLRRSSFTSNYHPHPRSWFPKHYHRRHRLHPHPRW